MQRAPSRVLPQRVRRRQFIAVAAVCAIVVFLLVGLTQTTSHSASGTPVGQFRHLSQASSGGASASASVTPVNRAFSALTSAWTASSQQLTQAAEPSSYTRGPTLVLYVYSTGDPLHTANFQYFLRWGMAASRSLEYLVAVRKQASPASAWCRDAARFAARPHWIYHVQDMAALPALPPHATYWQAPASSCPFDWGLLSEAIRAGKADRTRFQYFVFISSAVRGPFVPPYHLVRSLSCLACLLLCWLHSLCRQPVLKPQPSLSSLHSTISEQQYESLAARRTRGSTGLHTSPGGYRA